MKNFQKITLFFILLVFLSSCEKKQKELEFEKSVMTEIFPSLVDSICVDCRILFLPMPLGKSIFDKNDNYIGQDTSNIKADREKWEKELVKIKNDTSKIIIAFETKMKWSHYTLKDDFVKHFSGIKVIDSKTNQNLEYDFDFKNIKLNNKFELKNLSEFPKERGAIWNTKYNFIFSGVLDFSRIQFDKDKRFGVLDAGFGCGSKFGQGFRIYIKKINKKWVIDKIEGTWVS
jgi:hypothetical protein